jgi:riboflavin synthase
MFTGIVEELGTVRSLGGGRLRIACTTVATDAALGSSIAVQGVCLTVVSIEDDGLAFDLSDETLRRTTLGSLSSGAPVNLERPVTLGTRLGGHLVQGHVDGTGTVLAVTRAELGSEISFSIGPDLHRFLIEKGSITLDGVSLTVAGLFPGRFTVAFVPHTLSATSFGSAAPGAVVNVEIDLIARYVHAALREGADLRSLHGSVGEAVR